MFSSRNFQQVQTSFTEYLISSNYGKKYIASSQVMLVGTIFLEFRFNAIVSSALNVVFPEPTAPTIQ
ncbi:MAG: hypothetical protein EZS28_043481 [Streblomastix strix]|uniref:Uncharacterized protein n=1 Tax=Streblomastix strix TaxID=222440 RepID=A0A5J4TST9_9EUKA|nr:MAG: hypothetical protein EZS28_043481 [Streblomastix strix]